MSSEERDTAEPFAAPAKKRRIQRACDVCRQKRRACDGLRSSIKKCTYCVENGVECIYSGAPITTVRRQSYTQVLEQRLALTEKLLHKLSTERERSPGTSESSQWSKDSPISQHSKGTDAPSIEVVAMIRSLNAGELKSANEDAILTESLLKEMQGLRLESHEDRYLGKSSGAMLVKAAAELKAGYAPPGVTPRALFGARRMQYWTSQPWKRTEMETPKPLYAFPPPDVLAALVDLYFDHSNMYLPLLHRPTFMRALGENLHVRDEKFGANVLLVCAIGSRFSDDPRVFDPDAPLDCGWNYYMQLTPVLEHLYVTPTLYDIQRCCLTIQFLEGSAPQANWTLVGIGIRMAQEVGAHRRQPYVRLTAEAELWRRAFWMLLSYDRIISCTLGRPCAMQYDDLDLDLPTECDDEYWENEDPALAFRQPPGRPSQVAFFNSFLRLNNILAFSLHLLYSLNKTKELLTVRDAAWEEHIVVELDSALNKWVDAIPEHLRWDPNRADPMFFKQSVALYCSYYHVQMTTHRPFIPMMRELPPAALPSLAICTNAARSCSHVADVWAKRMGHTPAIILLPALTTAGVVLLLNVWSGKRTGVAPQMNTAIAEVHKIMQAIRVCEERWQMAGLFWDILNELANVGQVPLPVPTSQPENETPHRNTNTHKRAHSGSVSGSGDRQYSDVEVWPDPVDALDSVAGPFAWVGAGHEHGAPGTTAGMLPMYSGDLGRLPVYPQFDFNFAAAAAAHARAAPEAGGSQQGMQFPHLNLNPHPNPHPTTTGWAAMPMPLPDFTTGTVPQSEYHPPASTEDILSMLDNDAIAMWENVPTSLEVDDWGAYFSGMNEGQGGAPH
ncbi:fungal-specific transcription factor domain-containing protein [Mycena polygramma]|nr:fungal-specific transcription factor domain-containing protein [Mycena polygramma]